MYHSRFTGARFEAGFRWGQTLLKHSVRISESGLFSLDAERRTFAEKCLESYRKFYPGLLEEINGIAAGQQMSAKDLYGFLFSMYCFEPEHHCTCFAFRTDMGAVFGRNSDFLPSLEKLYDSCFYRLSDAYAFIGNTTAFTEIEDGINEYGLAVGLTFVYPRIVKPGLNAGMAVRYLLEKCRTTAEATEALRLLPIASSQVFTIADKTGDIAAVECNSEHISLIGENGRGFVAAVNDFHSEGMEKYKNSPQTDDWQSEIRYRTVCRTLERERGRYSLKLAKELLSGKFGFMCQYDRKKNADTVWSCVYDLRKDGVRAYRAEGNPSRKRFREETRLKFR